MASPERTMGCIYILTKLALCDRDCWLAVIYSSFTCHLACEKDRITSLLPSFHIPSQFQKFLSPYFHPPLFPNVLLCFFLLFLFLFYVPCLSVPQAFLSFFCFSVLFPCTLLKLHLVSRSCRIRVKGCAGIVRISWWTGGGDRA